MLAATDFTDVVQNVYKWLVCILFVECAGMTLMGLSKSSFHCNLTWMMELCGGSPTKTDRFLQVQDHHSLVDRNGQLMAK